MALYDSIARIYDPWSASVVEDIAFYVEEAKRCEDPVVELAVGSGRIAVPIAQAGRRVIGVDLSEGMLAVARDLAEEHGVGDLVDLRVGDLREPPVDERVQLVICPFRSLLHMPDEEQKLRALRAARGLLEPGGHLVFDVFAPSPEDISETDGLWLEREPGIFERADWDETTRTLRLSVRVGRLRRVDGPALALGDRVAPPDRRGGLRRRRPLRLVRPPPLPGRRGHDLALSPPRLTGAPVLRRTEPIEYRLVSWALIVVVVVVVLLVIYVIALYNGLVQKRNRVDNAWAQIEVQLKRRRDLIPNLVETVKGYAAHERGTFEAVTQARAAAAGAQGPAQTAAAEGILTQALGRLFAVAEAYPDLKASTNFLDLQTQLRDTEDKIAVSRQVYNDTVLTFNNGIQVFPAVLIAGMFGFTKREFFEVEDAADREVPVVSFQPPAADAAAPAAPPAGDAPAPPAS